MNESESTSQYNSSVLWAASFPHSDRPRRRNVHRRMHVEMQHQMREAVRMMHQRGVTDYRVSFEWTTDIVFDEQVHWLNITVEYDAANEQYEEDEHDSDH